MSLIKLIELFLKYLDDKDCSPHTIRNYRTTLYDFTVYLEEIIFNGQAFIENITLEHLQLYMSERKRRGNSGKTRANVLVALRSFWNYLCKRNYTSTYLPQQLDDIKIQKKERIYLNQEEVHILLNTIESPIVRAAAYTMSYSGLRISELIGLNKNDIDFQKNEIRVICGKGKKDRIVPLHPILKSVLKEYFINIRNPKSEKFFSTYRSGSLASQYVNECLVNAAKKAGINKRVTAHILRHSFASGLVSKNCNITIIQKLLGHSDLKTTSIYLHVNQQELKDAVNTLA